MQISVTWVEGSHLSSSMLLEGFNIPVHVCTTQEHKEAYADHINAIEVSLLYSPRLVVGPASLLIFFASG